MEKIGSVQENPFYTKYGLKQATITPRNKYGFESQPGRRRLSSNGSLGNGEEEEEEKLPEYKPGSGFVGILKDKWSHLHAQEKPTPWKRASSLEDLPADDDPSPKIKQITSKETNHNKFSSSKNSTSVLAPRLSHRAQSIESLNQVSKKHPHIHKPAHNLRHVETAWQNREPSVPLKSPRGSHVVAPDVDLARDDIIIIEKTQQPQVENAAESSESEDDSPPLSYREEILPNELPKPNTVQNVRNIFENNSSLPSSKNFFQLKKRTENSLVSPLTSPSQVASPTSFDDGMSIRSLSPLSSSRLPNSDSYAKSILSPPATNPPNLTWRHADPSKSATDSSLSPRFANLYPPRQGGSAGLEATNSRDKTSSPSVASVSNSGASKSDAISSFTEAKASSVLAHSNFSESPRLGEARPTPSPRSTATVKPTIASKHSPPVEPLPLSAPPSAATSYKRSSPVVPVAPYKDNKEDRKDDGQPVMIYSKSRLSPKREKVPRIHDYAPVNEPNGVPKDNIINKDPKMMLKDVKNNKSESLRNTAADRKPAQIEGDKIIQTPQQTTIQIGSSRKVMTVPDDKGIGKDQALFHPAVKSTKKTQAPSVPGLDKVKTQLAPKPPTQSMIYVSSSESDESDNSTPPETPRTKDDVKPAGSLKDRSSIEENIGSTPSLITVSRLKQDEGPAPSRFSSTPEKPVTSSAPSKAKENQGTLNRDNDNKRSLTSSSKVPIHKEKASETKKDSVLKNSVAPRESIGGSSSTDEQPIKGHASIIINRVRQTNNSPSQMASDVVVSNGSTFFKLDPSLNDESSTDSDASPRAPFSKPSGSLPGSQASSSPFAINLTSVTSSSASDSGSERDSLSSEITNEIAEVRSKMGRAKKPPGAVQIFDSTQLKKKKREPAAIVPPLDFSGIHEDRSKNYCPPQTKIEPCNIKFIGENARTERSLLVKQRKVKVSFGQ
ncbi:hypothetical protein PoB_007550400 [Plakobranchus ocellatus]|uniref:Uncharacterized protein n=1 Tax=Plakobranchus ocellatus TaxID=259542 RepID=A0AAV4DXR4_9GAST|nr:hypothetical protein PoB_007550400 [Plakobranchus ocellatus]